MVINAPHVLALVAVDAKVVVVSVVLTAGEPWQKSFQLLRNPQVEQGPVHSGDLNVTSKMSKLPPLCPLHIICTRCVVSRFLVKNSPIRPFLFMKESTG